MHVVSAGHSAATTLVFNDVHAKKRLSFEHWIGDKNIISDVFIYRIRSFLHCYICSGLTLQNVFIATTIKGWHRLV